MDLLTKITWLIDRAKEGMDRPLSLKAAAVYLDVSRSTLYKMVHQKKISYYKPNGKMLYFSLKDLKDFAFSNNIKRKEKKS